MAKVKSNRYAAIVEEIFHARYRTGQREVAFEREDLGVCRIGRTEEAKECWSGLQSDYGLHESMLSQIVG